MKTLSLRLTLDYESREIEIVNNEAERGMTE